MAITTEELQLLSAEITALLVEHGVPSTDVRVYVHAAQSPDAWIGVVVPTAQREKLLKVLPTKVRGVMARLATPGVPPIAIRENKLDGKFHGAIYHDTTGMPVPPDEFMVFCAYDDAIPGTLEKYVDECITINAPPAQIDAARRLLERVRAWRETHGPRCRKPGSGETPRVVGGVSDRVPLWPRDTDNYPGDESALPSALPPIHQEKVAGWLEINQKKSYEVFHGVYPLGFVQNLIERVAKAEQAAGIANNGITAGCYSVPKPEQAAS
jgi:hypothetical protein